MAANKEDGSGFVHECFYRCESKKHASHLTATVTKSAASDEKISAYIKWCCVKYTQAVDFYGRTLLQMAASKGRLKLLVFLLTHKEVNINHRDLESFYSALHRSLFYGQIHCAVRLIQAGANLQLSDYEDLTPLDHIMKDRPSILTYNASLPCEVYVWGMNTNYTLGIGHNHSRTHPEPLDFFRKENISVKQGFISKFHSLFLGTNGKVWTCGVGTGGRLGLGDEVATLIPKPLKIGSNSSECCIGASLGIDHSVLLMENGSVWSFGLNKYHQLGHSPVPEKLLLPKAIKALRGLLIIGVSASKFHTIFWTQNQVYTCGLHGGQLGHSKTNENTIVIPKLVTLLQLKSATITQVATSDGATVAVSSKGDVFLFHEYQCKKLTTKTNKLIAKKICVVGGHLDHRVYSECLQEKGGHELKILILTSQNSIYIWQEAYQQMTRCLLSLHRYLDITDIVLNKVNLIVTTHDGEAFLGEVKTKKHKIISDDDKPTSPKSNPGNFLNKEECNLLKLKRIPHIHRAVNVACDLKGRNFAVVQVHPKSGLLKIPLVEATEFKQNMKMLLTTASEYDNVHDVLFQVDGILFPAHRYVVCHSSSVLEELINKSEAVNNVSHVKIENVQSQIFQRILSYMYTGECDLLQNGICPIRFDSSALITGEELFSEANILNKENITAFEYYKQQKSNKRKSELKNESKARNPVKALRDAAKTFGLTDLVKILEFFRYDNGYVSQINNKNLQFPPPKFNRKNLQNLWDLSLESDNGEIIKVHKCILTARMEYFNCMINQGWMESTMKTPLKLPIPGNVLEILIRFLYTDEAPELLNSDDSDLASHVLVISDQYFCTRLKEIAEASLGNMLNLKNTVEILQLAVTYNADQLKQCAMEFVCLNLSSLLESQSLEILDDSVLTDLTDFYRSWLPCMSNRNIVPYSDAPDDDLIEAIYNSEPISLMKTEEETAVVKSACKTSKKKSHREKKTSESESRKARNTSTGSTTSDEEALSSLDYSDGGVREEAWIKVTNHSTKHQQKIRLAKSNLSPSATRSSQTLPTKPIRTPIVIQNSNPINVGNISTRAKTENFDNYGKDGLFLSTSCEKEFPALSASAPDRIINISNIKSPNENFKKLVKISQKQRRRLATQSISEGEETSRKPENIKSVWGVPKCETQSLVDIMKQEVKSGFVKTSLASSPQWQGPSSPDCSLSAIMAAERQQKDLLLKMKTKPLEYTQMEDKAIDDLMLLYDVQNVTDEKITIRRADFAFHSPPVWVTGQR